MAERIRDYPLISDISFIQLNTPIAIQHPCDQIITRTTVEDVCRQMSGVYQAVPDPKLYGWNKLTDQDRLNLCDIVWFLKGLSMAEKSPFNDQIDSLESVVKALGDKFKI